MLSAVPRLALLGLLITVAGPVAGQTPPTAPTAALLSADARVVAGQVGRRILVWQRATGKQLASWESDPMFRGSVTAGALVAVTDDGIFVHRGPRFTRRVPLRWKGPTPLSIGRAVLSADGRVVAALYTAHGGAGDPDTVAVWNARSGQLLLRVLLHTGRALGVALSRDGTTLAIFGDLPGKEARLQVHRLDRPHARVILRWTSEADRTTTCAAFAPDGDQLALCAGRRLLLWKLPGRHPIAQASTARIKALFPPVLRGPTVRMPAAHQIAFSRDGKQLVTLHGFGVVGVARWSVSPLAPRAWIKRPLKGGPMRQVAWDADGGLWLVSSSYSPRVWIQKPKGDRFSPSRVLSP